MNKTIPQHYLSRIWRAIVEFDLLSDNDSVLIGLSGGKDSMFLTYALSVIQKHAPFKFKLAAFTVDPLFTNDFNIDYLNKFCSSLGIPFYTEKVDIAGIINNNNSKDHCFTCAFFRRGAVNGFAEKNGFNKVALAHHHDDAVETFLMGILYSGQLKTFLPKTYLDRTKITVIRPLVYFRERELVLTPKLHGFTPLKSPCPFDGHTKRQEIKEMIHQFENTDSAFYMHLSAAMRASKSTELWPAEPPRDELIMKHKNFWKQKTRA